MQKTEKVNFQFQEEESITSKKVKKIPILSSAKKMFRIIFVNLEILGKGAFYFFNTFSKASHIQIRLKYILKITEFIFFC